MPRRTPEPEPEPPKKYAAGHHPNSLAALRPRTRGSVKPTRKKFKALLVKELEKKGWTGNPDTTDFHLYVSAKYDYDFERRGGAERSRLRRDLMELGDRLGLGVKAKPTREKMQGMPDRSPERLAAVAKLLARQGAWGPEPQKLAMVGELVDTAMQDIDIGDLEDEENDE